MECGLERKSRRALKKCSTWVILQTFRQDFFNVSNIKFECYRTCWLVKVCCDLTHLTDLKLQKKITATETGKLARQTTHESC